MIVVRNEEFLSGSNGLVFGDNGESDVLRTALLFLLCVLNLYFNIVHEVIPDNSSLPKVIVESLLKDAFGQIPVRSEADAGGVLVTVTLAGVAGDGKIETSGVSERGLRSPQFRTLVFEKTSDVSVFFFLSVHLKVDCVCDKIDR